MAPAEPAHLQRAPREQRGRWLAAVLLGLLLTGTWVHRAQLLEQQLPYSGHMDERPLNQRARAVVAEGQLDPGWFEYPSLPIYLSAAGMAVGVALAELRGELEGAHQIGRVGHPYYSQPGVMRAPRLLFITLGVLSLLFAALAALHLTGSRVAMLAAPPFALLSPELLSLTWSYVNVDTCATFFCAVATWLAISRLERTDLLSRALIPGLICGAATASKYNSGLIVVPFLIAIAARVPSPGRKLAHAACLGTATAAAFVVFVPYSLLTHERFMSDVLKQVQHYREGHRGYEAEPGLDQLSWYVGMLTDEFGLVALLLAALGIVWGLRRDPLRTAVVAAFPVLMILYMSTNRTHFVRTVLPVFPPLAVLMAAGAHGLLRRAHGRLQALTSRPRALQRAAAVLVAGAVLLSAPLPRLYAQAFPTADSRKLALEWIERHLPAGAVILHPKRLAWDTRGLSGTHEFVSYKAKQKKGLRKALERTAGRKRYLVVPEFGFDPRQRGGPAGARKARKQHAQVPGLRPLVSFGRHDVAINRGPAFPRDPRFTIAAID